MKGDPMQNITDYVFRFRKVYYRDLEPFCRQWDLTRNELDVILFLTNHPGLDRASDIASHRSIAKSHISQSVAALEQRGLLQRCPDPDDRRIDHLKLTEQSLPMVRMAVRHQQDFFRRLCASLTPEDIAHWNEIAEKLRSTIEEMEQTKE